MFQNNVKRVLPQNKAHTKRVGFTWFAILQATNAFNYFFPLIFLLSFLVNLGIALYQQGLIDLPVITELIELLG